MHYSTRTIVLYTVSTIYLYAVCTLRNCNVCTHYLRVASNARTICGLLPHVNPVFGTTVLINNMHVRSTHRCFACTSRFQSVGYVLYNGYVLSFGFVPPQGYGMLVWGLGGWKWSTQTSSPNNNISSCHVLSCTVRWLGTLQRLRTAARVCTALRLGNVSVGVGWLEMVTTNIIAKQQHLLMSCPCAPTNLANTCCSATISS